MTGSEDLLKSAAEGKHKTHCKVCGKLFAQTRKDNFICSEKCRKKRREDIKNFKGTTPHNTYLLKLRFEVFKRDNFTCQYCGRDVKTDKIKLHCDHIIPRAKGGQTYLKTLLHLVKSVILEKLMFCLMKES